MSNWQTTIEQGLKKAIGDGFALRCETNSKGVTTAWCRLQNHQHLMPVATLLKEMAARLSAITASLPAQPPPDGAHELAYHFDLDGHTLTVSFVVPRDREMESLTPLFGNADWNEREFAELYNIKLRGQSNPRRLFIDSSIEPAVLDRLIPFSSLVNAASSKTLWERILGQNGAKR